MNKSVYHAVVIGASSGGLKAISRLLNQLPANFSPAVIIVSHRTETPDSYLTQFLGSISLLKVQDAENLEPIKANNVYIAPPGYHLLISDEFCFNLTVDPHIHASRPSIDLTFETAAEAYGNRLIGIILTGANSDGALGLKRIKEANGYTIVQDPKTADARIMPDAAIQATKIDYIGDLDQICKKLCELSDTTVPS